MSEKIDGVRAFWNGEKLISRHGNDLQYPDWFIEGLPSGIHLDGELWLGRGLFEEIIGLTHGTGDVKLWKSARYVIFDLPSSKQPYEIRMKELRSIKLPPHVEIISSWRCNGNDGLHSILNVVVGYEGEGFMAIKPQSLYMAGERTDNLLKVKTQNDNEVFVMEVIPTGLYCLQ